MSDLRRGFIVACYLGPAMYGAGVFAIAVSYAPHMADAVDILRDGSLSWLLLVGMLSMVVVAAGTTPIARRRWSYKIGIGLGLIIIAIDGGMVGLTLLRGTSGPGAITASLGLLSMHGTGFVLLRGLTREASHVG